MPSEFRGRHLLQVLAIVVLLVLSGYALHLPSNFQEDFETTPDLIVQHGYPMEIHTVASEDGYLLTLHRIPFSGRVSDETDRPTENKRTTHTKEYHKQWHRYDKHHARGDETVSNKPIVFIQHGVFASSLDWVLTGPDNALGYRMSDAGYDVWLGNLRGNIYSSEHVNMTRKNPKFWNFSWHEIGMHDLPAMIDYILEVTMQPTLNFIGHSMGATAAVVMLTEKPQYNLKLGITILLAPVVKLQHNTSILRFSAPFWKALKQITNYSGLFGFPPTPERLQRRLQPVCAEQIIGSGICALILDTVAGYAKQFNQTLLPTLFGHYPTQTSTKTMSHFMQGMHTGNFSHYDYGTAENIERYNQSLPLLYDISKMTTTTAIFYGDSDPFTDLQDLYWLANELPNVYGSYRVPSESFSHLSFLWATDVDTVLYTPLLQLLAQLRRD